MGDVIPFVPLKDQPEHVKKRIEKRLEEKKPKSWVEQFMQSSDLWEHFNWNWVVG